MENVLFIFSATEMYDERTIFHLVLSLLDPIHAVLQTTKKFIELNFVKIVSVYNTIN